ncbi:hypothetical protein Metbo_2316 [Methanobacterium lacus]|uniref:SbsA Ig-like domain-containing protein n=1 Tax=Methanobacterium lacus (strain AL-21) TaxID=877455 RepID=F0T623_METLA|nr:hypothetical protein Metbo_2316 [Methanobacterium lacus]
MNGGIVRTRFMLVILIFILFSVLGTVSAKDVSKPAVVSMDPVNNSCILSGSPVLKVVFSENIKLGTDYVELRNSNKKDIPINKSLNNSILTIKPNTILTNGSKYTLYLHSGSYTDFAGNSMNIYSTCFTVKTAPSYQIYLEKIQTDMKIKGKSVYAEYAIYQKPTNSTTWNRYLFNHIVNKAKTGVNGPENDYRISKLQNVVLNDNTKNLQIKSSTDLTSPGNWEKAVLLTGKSEKIGGMHGYENYTEIVFYKDGKLLFPNINNPITKCKNLQIKETSNLFNPNNPSQIVAKTITTYEWNGEALKIQNIYNWKINTTVLEAYVAMFPTKNSPTVTSEGKINGLLTENFQTRTTDLHGNSAIAVVWNNLNNLHMSMEITNPIIAFNNYSNTGNTTHGETWFRTASSYIKLYMSRVCQPKTEKITPNTTWNIQTTYKVWNT